MNFLSLHLFAFHFYRDAAIWEWSLAISADQVDTPDLGGNIDRFQRFAAQEAKEEAWHEVKEGEA